MKPEQDRLEESKQLDRAKHAAHVTSIQSMQDMLARIGAALYAVDAQTQEYTYVSPMYTEILGYTHDDIAAYGGRQAFLQHLVVNETLEEMANGFSRLKDGAEERLVREHKVWCRRKDGTLRFIDDYWIPAYENGRLVRTYGILRDITAQKQTENALVETENTYLALFHAIADPVMIFSKATHRILDCNGPMLARYGYTLAELQRMTPLDLHPPGELLEQAESNIDDEDDESAHTYIHHTKEGSAFPVETHTSPVHFEGQDAWITIIRDVTERQKAEEQAKRYTAEIEAANEEIKQFAYIVSHDLRGPLVNLKGFSAELRRALDTVAPIIRQALAALPDEDRTSVRYAVEEDIPEALQFIDSSVTRMDRFINAVLKLSRIGHRHLAFEPIDPTPLVHDILDTLTHQREERNASATVSDLPVVVADRTALEQVFGNLLSNALLYLAPDRPGEVAVGGESRPHETLFWVRDNGCGISKDDAEKVFAPFRRAGRQDVPGEGMGLSYVHTLVRQHGGQIWFESEPDRGTTFFFTISNTVEPQGGDSDFQS